MVSTTDDFEGTAPEASVEAAPETPDTTPTRVVMRVQISGTRDGQDWPPIGGELTVPAFEAASLYHNSQAEPAPEPSEEPEAEEAAIVTDETPPERAVVSRARSARPARGGRSKGEQK